MPEWASLLAGSGAASGPASGQCAKQHVWALSGSSARECNRPFTYDNDLSIDEPQISGMPVDKCN